MTSSDGAADSDDSLRQLVTESNDPQLAEMDSIDTIERLHLFNAEDARIIEAVRQELPHVAAAIHAIVRSFRNGGRLIYVGAGTSGRLGVLDASECPPTFGTDPGLVKAIIAGGERAVFNSIEGAEDDASSGSHAIDEASVNNKDTVVGISASGQAPFVIAALHRANELGAYTVALCNNRPSKLSEHADLTIAPIVGPEIIAGSTRLKAGTSQKIVLNLLTTNAMIESGKTYGNLMVDVRATNTKLKMRALRIVMDVTGEDKNAASAALAASGGRAKLAILMLETGLNPAEAEELLDRHQGFLRRAMQQHDRSVTFD